MIIKLSGTCFISVLQSRQTRLLHILATVMILTLIFSTSIDKHVKHYTNVVSHLVKTDIKDVPDNIIYFFNYLLKTYFILPLFLHLYLNHKYYYLIKIRCLLYLFFLQSNDLLYGVTSGFKFSTNQLEMSY